MVAAEQARSMLAVHGKLKAQSPDEWTGEFPIPASVAQFYRDVGPVNVTIRTSGNPFFLPRLSRLWKFQYGYRYVGPKREREPSWHDDWLVIADQGGDPLILSRASGTVLFAEHGTGSWVPVELFPDLNAMAACLARLGGFDAGGESEGRASARI